MVQGTSFSQVRLAQPTDRMVLAGDGGFKAANSGSIGSRIVNVLKEAFFKDTVKAENRGAYQAAREGWRAQHGNETAAVREFFDSRIASGERFDASARDKLLGLPALSYNLAPAGEETRGIVENTLKGLKEDARSSQEKRFAVGGDPDVTLSPMFLKDAARRMTVMLDDGPLLHDGRIGGDGGELKPFATGSQDNADAIGSRLVDAFGAEWAGAISDYVHQGLVSAGTQYAQFGTADMSKPLDVMPESPFRLPGGESVSMMGVKPGFAIHLSRNADGGVHIQCDIGFNVGAKRDEERRNAEGAVRFDGTGTQEKGIDVTYSPAALYSDDSSFMLSYGFDLVRDPATHDIAAANATPISFAAQYRERVDG